MVTQQLSYHWLVLAAYRPGVQVLLLLLRVVVLQLGEKESLRQGKRHRAVLPQAVVA